MNPLYVLYKNVKRSIKLNSNTQKWSQHDIIFINHTSTFEYKFSAMIFYMTHGPVELLPIIPFKKQFTHVNEISENEK